MNVVIHTIPHNQQRYPTVGDWTWEPNGDLVIKVSDLGDWRYTMLVALHELVEVLKCKHDGVSQKSVDDFDIVYEKNRQNGDDSEPGDSVGAPYMKQHCLATGIERIMASELDVSWKVYEEVINGLT